MSHRIEIRLSDELVELVDSQRGLVPRATWIADIVRRAVERRDAAAAKRAVEHPGTRPLPPGYELPKIAPRRTG